MDRTALRGWFGELGEVLDKCLADSIAQSDALTATYDLLLTGPADICGPIKPSLTRATLECLLEAEAFESAALRLVERCGYVVSRGGQGQVIASVVLPGSDRDYSFNASSEAIALCGALATCIHEKPISG
jgi:hypothetical protein